MSKLHSIFSESDLKLIENAIQSAESQTTGEIKIHIQQSCNEDPVTHAGKIFQRLGMHKTKKRNGILFYLAIKSKSFALVGDIGIHEKVGQSFWEGTRDEVLGYLKKGEIANGLVSGVHHCGNELKKYFPVLHSNNPNEISNEISVE